jgi:hypothetical protein
MTKWPDRLLTKSLEKKDFIFKRQRALPTKMMPYYFFSLIFLQCLQREGRHGSARFQ